MTRAILNALYFGLYFTAVLSDRIPELINSITESVTMGKIHHLYNMCNVMIDDSGQHEMEIFMYVSDAYNTHWFGSTNVFFTALSCGIANWAANTIDLVVRDFSPLFHEAYLQDYDKYKADGVNLFKKKYFEFKNSIQKYLTLFVVAINNIIESNWVASYYKNISVLETLTSLRISIVFLSSWLAESSSNDKKSHLKVIQLLLEHMKAFQIYLSMNCSAVLSVLESSTFFVTWIKPNILGGNDNDSKELTGRKINLILDGQLMCLPTQSILNEFVNPSILNETTIMNVNNINQTYIIFKKKISIIKDIFDQFQNSGNIEMIYFYQDYIMLAIMKNLFYQVICLLENKYVDYSRDAFLKIEIIHEKIF